MATASETETKSETITKITLKSARDLDKFIRQDESDDLYNIKVEFAMCQEELMNLSDSSVGRRVIELDIWPAEYDDNNAPLVDFSKVKFPSLVALHLQYQAVQSVHFTKENTPRLQRLSINQPCAEILEYFNTDLPELTYMGFRSVDIDDSTGFGKSLSRCPKLRTFYAYKLWGLRTTKSNKHLLVLPNCEELQLDRSDDLNYLKIWAPRLKELSFEGCFCITEVNLLNKKPKGYTSPEYAFKGTPSQYKVNFLNISRPAGNITSHPRCRAIYPDKDLDDFNSHASYRDITDWWAV